MMVFELRQKMLASFYVFVRLLEQASEFPTQTSDQNKCLVGSVFFIGLLCSLQRFSTFLSVSPIYSSPHEHLPLYITQEGCGFLLLTLNSDFTFLVIHFIAIL